MSQVPVSNSLIQILYEKVERSDVYVRNRELFISMSLFSF